MTLTLARLFGEGMLTFLTPCVLPMIPVYLAALVGGDLQQAAREERGRVLARAGLFAVGFIAVFSLMGLAASSAGSFLSGQRPVLRLAGGVLILLFGLKFLGVIRVDWMDRVVKLEEGRFRTRFGGTNAVLMGVVFAAGWSPCVGPMLGYVLTYTATAATSPIQGAFYLSVYGFGFAVPLLLTAAFAGVGVRALRRLGRFLPRIEKAVGVVLVVGAVVLLHGAVSSGGGGADGRTPAKAAASGGPVAGRPSGIRTGRVAEPARAGRTETGAPTCSAPAARPGAAAASAGSGGDSARAGLSKTRLPRMVELYTRSCPVCRRMKPVVAAVTSACRGRRVKIELRDVSRAENRHLVSRYRLVGVPTFVFIDKNGRETARLIGEQTPQALRQALSALMGSPCPGVGQLPFRRLKPSGSGRSNKREGTSCTTRSGTVKGVDGRTTARRSKSKRMGGGGAPSAGAATPACSLKAEASG